jgi:hypothetical protein
MEFIKTLHCAAIAAIVTLATCGCTSLKEIRTDTTPSLRADVDVGNEPRFKCETGQPSAAETHSVIEDYQRYWLSFVEFDDQGWSHSGQRQMTLMDDRLKTELADPRFKDVDFDVIVFIHGWHHNAYDNDCNVMEFRSMLKRAADRADKEAESGLERKRRLVGIYVGWRGESVSPRWLRALTVLDRRFTAEHVAKGEVRQLFATLRKRELAMNASDPTAQPAQAPRNRLRSMGMGHSFGGLIAFHSLSQAMLNELTLTKPNLEAGCNNAATSGKPGDAPASWPDLLVLINPAFEASRFEALHAVVKKVPGCPYNESLAPKLVVVTADNDWATGWVFTTGRKILTVFETYSEDGYGALKAAEEAANLHAIGFVHRYRTHRLCRVDSGANSKQTVAVFTPSPDVAAADVEDPAAPVWVVGAAQEIINGHDGFLYATVTPGTPPEPFLLEWLLDLHTGIRPERPTAKSRAPVAKEVSCGPWPD